MLGALVGLPSAGCPVASPPLQPAGHPKSRRDWVFPPEAASSHPFQLVVKCSKAPALYGTVVAPLLNFEMLYLIGLGLGDAKDITVKGLEVVRRCSRVYLEAYTSVLTVGKEALEEFYGRKLILADREEVEQEADNILKDADISDVAFLVVGDPLG
ncbi:hypothetical protein CB1_001428108 [Camelus ferus]|nr:hypothetical protein CB1_001428108 [Camelus ferus]